MWLSAYPYLLSPSGANEIWIFWMKLKPYQNLVFLPLDKEYYRKKLKSETPQKSLLKISVM